MYYKDVTDREYALNFVHNIDYHLYFCLDNFHDDDEITIFCVEKDGRLIQHASERFRADEELIRKIMKQNGNYLMYATDELKHRRDMVMYSFSCPGSSTLCQFEEYFNDIEVVLEALKYNSDATKFCGKLDFNYNLESLAKYLKRSGKSFSDLTDDELIDFKINS